MPIQHQPICPVLMAQNKIAFATVQHRPLHLITNMVTVSKKKSIGRLLARKPHTAVADANLPPQNISALLPAPGQPETDPVRLLIIRCIAQRLEALRRRTGKFGIRGFRPWPFSGMITPLQRHRPGVVVVKSGTGRRFDRNVITEIIRVKLHFQTGLFQGGKTIRTQRFRLCRIQGRKQNGRKDRNNCNYNYDYLLNIQYGVY